jgi:hypothetical protein
MSAEKVNFSGNYGLLRSENFDAVLKANGDFYNDDNRISNQIGAR